MKSFFTFYLAATCVVAVLLCSTSCLEDEELTASEIPFQQESWRLTSVVSDEKRTVGGITSRDWRSQMDACRKDDIYYRSSIHESFLSTDEGEDICSSSDRQVVSNAIILTHQGDNHYQVTLMPSAKRMIYDYMDSFPKEEWTLESSKSNELIFSVYKDYQGQLYLVTLTFTAL